MVWGAGQSEYIAAIEEERKKRPNGCYLSANYATECSVNATHYSHSHKYKSPFPFTLPLSAARSAGKEYHHHTHQDS